MPRRTNARRRSSANILFLRPRPSPAPTATRLRFRADTELRKTEYPPRMAKPTGGERHESRDFRAHREFLVGERARDAVASAHCGAGPARAPDGVLRKGCAVLRGIPPRPDD